MITRVTIFLTLIVVTGCSSPLFRTEPAKKPPSNEANSAWSVHEIDPEEYTVYGVVLDAVRTPELNTLLLSRRTIPWAWRNDEAISLDPSHGGEQSPGRSKTNEGIPGLSPETVGNYRQKNVKAYQLEDRFDPTMNIVLLDRKEFQDLEWKEILRNYPQAGGYRFRLSRVGFNKEKTKALVYVDKYRNASDAQGCHYYLVKQGGGWVIQAKTLGWNA